ncbi:MAG: radical SAM protein [Smithellaceae bacterium]|nr:radical SAM protein [Smithellaceae bacterium]
MKNTIEQGPIRPPSEADSLLIRVTRNCPWNKCAFCHTYDGTKFEVRPMAEIKEDILTVREIAERIREAVGAPGGNGEMSGHLLQILYQRGYSPEAVLPVVHWLSRGGENVFLQDGNSLILKTPDLVEILRFIKESLPTVKRITSYCRSQTARKKTREEFDLIAQAGLSRIHIGMESGYDPLLKFIKKGSSQADHIEGGRKIKAAGISLCEYVMPGLGGKRWTEEHARETAHAINMINPDFVRLRSLYVVGNTELYRMTERGEFESLTEEETLQEIKRFIGGLEGIETTLISDHILNLLEEIEGKLPEDKGRMLGVIDRFFSLPGEERLIFRLGRRLGYYRRLDDLGRADIHDSLKNWLARHAKDDAGKLEQRLSDIMQGYI